MGGLETAVIVRYVNGNTGTADDATVRGIFGAYGTISTVKILPPKGDKGACIVKFATQPEAEWIVENLNGNIAQGLETAVIVRYVGGLPADTTDGDLYAMFAPFG